LNYPKSANPVLKLLNKSVNHHEWPCINILDPIFIHNVEFRKQLSRNSAKEIMILW